MDTEPDQTPSGRAVIGRVRGRKQERKVRSARELTYLSKAWQGEQVSWAEAEQLSAVLGYLANDESFVHCILLNSDKYAKALYGTGSSNGLNKIKSHEIQR